ncbi:MAG: hypothetical protein ACR2PW_01495 [Gammaproteobacteria bacterium]
MIKKIGNNCFSALCMLGALVLTVSSPAGAQDTSSLADASSISPNIGYYYWDLVGIKSRKSFTTVAVDGSFANANEENYDVQLSSLNNWEYDSTKIGYVYDFCGKTNYLLGFSLERVRPRPDAKLINSLESEHIELFLGHHWKISDFASFYFKAGQILSEGFFTDYYGIEQRSSLEIGFRSRVGDRKNLELINTTRYDEFDQLQVSVGWLYHSAGSFSFGFTYNLRGDTEIEHFVNSEEALTTLEGQDDVSFTFRINL